MVRFASLAAVLMALTAASSSTPNPAHAAAGKQKGSATGLPIPRYVSLKSNRVNVRRGPGFDHAITWIYQRAGLPVEVLGEYGPWRRIRDSEGAAGWIYGRLLSGRRTVLIAPWSPVGASAPSKTANENAEVADAGNRARRPLKSKPSRRISIFSADQTSSRVVALAEPGVIANVARCTGDWCQVSLDLGRDGATAIRGWIEQRQLWGVYSGERVK